MVGTLERSCAVTPTISPFYWGRKQVFLMLSHESYHFVEWNTALCENKIQHSLNLTVFIVQVEK